MKKTLLVLAAALALTCVASADTANFTTSGSFACNGQVGCGAIAGGLSFSVTGGTVSITFAGNGAGVVNNAGSASWGVFSVTTTNTALQSIGTLATFTLTISQTAPSSGSGSVGGTLSGNVQVSGGQIIITFSNPGTGGSAPGQIKIGNTTYQVTFDNGIGIPANSVGINPGNGTESAVNTDKQMFVTVIPEPASLVLFGTGLTSMVGFLRRRLKK